MFIPDNAYLDTFSEQHFICLFLNVLKCLSNSFQSDIFWVFFCLFYTAYLDTFHSNVLLVLFCLFYCAYLNTFQSNIFFCFFLPVLWCLSRYLSKQRFIGLLFFCPFSLVHFYRLIFTWPLFSVVVVDLFNHFPVCNCDYTWPIYPYRLPGVPFNKFLHFYTIMLERC